MAEPEPETTKVSEIRYTCKACGHIWHVSKGCCGGPPGAGTSEGLGKCPQCGSRASESEEVEYEVRKLRLADTRGIAGVLFRLYKKHISQRLAAHCRFSPTCSEYAYLAVERYGALEGVIKTASRLRRCRPHYLGPVLDEP